MNPTEDIRELVRWAKRIALALADARAQSHRADDAKEAALIALADALRTDDATRVEPFKALARVRITGEVLDVLARERKRATSEASLEDLLGATNDDEEHDARNTVAGAVILRRALVEQAVDGEAEAVRRDLLEALRREMAALAPTERQLLELRDMKALPWSAVVAALGMSERALRDHHRRLHTRLREKLVLLLARGDASLRNESTPSLRLVQYPDPPRE